MKKLQLLLAIGLLISCKNTAQTEMDSAIAKNEGNRPPNIVLLYVDDLGYADVGAYGAKGVETPNIDKLAKKGIKFTDGHSSSATCTPSRYSLLTGNYAFRNNAAILPGDAPLLIDPEQSTVPEMLKSAGYTTGIVGKWHLGLGRGEVNWNEKIDPGPKTIGFDYSFLIPATGDRVPTVFVENGRVVNASEDDPIIVSYEEKVGDRPTGIENPELLKFGADKQHSQTIVNGVSRIGFMGGGSEAEWIDEEFPFKFNEKAFNFIKENEENPFFLFYSFHDIHVPRVPHERFQKKSSMGPRGDAIAQVDYVVGEIVEKLEELSLAENTLILFTSDNGPVLDDGYHDKAVELVGEHDPSSPFRGGKYSAYEAGTRVPTIVYWPGTIEPKISNALITQVDLYSSLASFVGAEVGEDVIDSQNSIDSWLGRSDQGRSWMLQEAFTLGLRDGDWKYIEPFQGKRVPGWLANKAIETGISDKPQLYNLSVDIAEQKNLAEQEPQLVEKYQKKIEEIKNRTSTSAAEK